MMLVLEYGVCFIQSIVYGSAPGTGVRQWRISWPRFKSHDLVHSVYMTGLRVVWDI